MDRPPVDVLFVDDEPHILSALRRLFHGENNLHCHFADSPAEALRILAERKIAVLVSDHRMPQMSGAEFLARVKEKRPHTIRMMLTGQAGIDDVKKAVNEGEIFRFLLKPWNDDELRQAVRSAVDLYFLTEENERLKRLLEQKNEELEAANTSLEKKVEERTAQLTDALYTAKEANQILEDSVLAIIKTFTAQLELARPDIGNHARRVAELAVAIGREYDLPAEHVGQLEVAALLHDVGKVSMPPYLVEKSAEDYSTDEFEVYKQHPLTGAACFDLIPHLSELASWIAAHHERYDGSGFPWRKREDQIPLEAYLLGLSDWWDHQISRTVTDREMNYQRTVRFMEDLADIGFPTELVQITLKVVERQHNEFIPSEATRVRLSDLAPQMEIVRNIYSRSGTLLLAKGAILTSNSISRLRAIARVDPIAGDLLVHWKRKRNKTTSGLVTE